MLAILLTTSCTSLGSDEPLFFGSKKAVETAANAARHCGVRKIRLGTYEGQTALFIPSKARLSPDKDCLHAWWREQDPPEVGMVVIAK